jgi:endoglycosylceramidase
MCMRSASLMDTGMHARERRSLRGFAALSVATTIFAGWLTAPQVPLVVATPAPARPAANTLPWVSRSAAGIVDEDGRQLVLRGFNTAALLEWPRQPIAPLEESDVEMIHRSGFNIVRLPISWSRLEPRRGRIDDEYLDRVAETVDLLRRHGLYVILNLHITLAWGPHFGGAGAPAWAAVPLVPHVPLAAPGEWTEMLSPAVIAAGTYFWLEPDWQADLELVWQAVVARFRDQSNVVGYDLLNEPNGLPLPPVMFEERWLWPLYARLISAIARVDSNHLYLIEGTLQSEQRLVPSTVVPLDARGLVFSPHLYTGSQVAPLFPDDPQETGRRIRQQADDSRHVPAVPWWGELGIVMDRPYATGWADSALDTFDDLAVGWAWWQWRQEWNWGIRNQSGDFVNRDFLRHLARPFVAAAPAGVRAGRGDGLRGELAVVVQADHADLKVSVSWPVATLSAPRVAEGDCVQSADWDPAAARLTLTLRPRSACTIRLTAS